VDDIRVGIVTPGFPPQVGGLESVTGRLGEALVARGHQVTVLAHSGPGVGAGSKAPTVPTELDVQRFPTLFATTPFPLSPGLWRSLRAVQGELDVVNVHSFHASLGLAASFVVDRPLVFTPHYHGAGHTAAGALAHRFYDPLAKRIFERAAAVICVSRCEAEVVARDYPFVGGKIEVVHNGVDVSDILSARRFDGQPPTILYVGRLERYKQVEPLLRSMLYLDDSVRLVIVGEGSDGHRLRGIAERLGISARVRFAGCLPSEEVRRWQRTAEVAACLSRHEAFGLSVVEAAVAGARVLASDIPAHREVAGKLAERVEFVGVDSDPSELAQLISRAISAGRHTPLAETSELDWDTSAARTEACLIKALG
jgi:glycosyltransferase involved in cell wall biosynthesis